MTDLTTTEKVATKPMKTLSPAAQAFLIAAYRLPLNDGQPDLAAALEALADQVVPAEAGPSCEGDEYFSRWEDRCSIRSEILAIAAELRGTTR